MNDPEINALVAAIHRYTASDKKRKSEDRSARLRDIFVELVHVLDLLSEEVAAYELSQAADDLDFDMFGIAQEYREFEEETDKFLFDHFDTDSREDIAKAKWVKAPKGVMTSDAEELLEAFGSVRHVIEVEDAVVALKKMAEG